MAWYVEEKNTFSRYVPAIYADRPKEVTASGTKRQFRVVKEIPNDEYAKLGSLEAVRQKHGYFADKGFFTSCRAG